MRKFVIILMLFAVLVSTCGCAAPSAFADDVDGQTVLQNPQEDKELEGNGSGNNENGDLKNQQGNGENQNENQQGSGLNTPVFVVSPSEYQVAVGNVIVVNPTQSCSISIAPEGLVTCTGETPPFEIRGIAAGTCTLTLTCTEDGMSGQTATVTVVVTEAEQSQPAPATMNVQTALFACVPELTDGLAKADAAVWVMLAEGENSAKLDQSSMQVVWKEFDPADGLKDFETFTAGKSYVLGVTFVSPAGYAVTKDTIVGFNKKPIRAEISPADGTISFYRYFISLGSDPVTCKLHFANVEQTDAPAFSRKSYQDQEVEYHNLPLAVDDPEKEGYVFAGWFADSSCKIPFSFDKELDQDVNVYAKWAVAAPDIDITLGTVMSSETAVIPTLSTTAEANVLASGWGETADAGPTYTGKLKAGQTYYLFGTATPKGEGIAWADAGFTVSVNGTPVAAVLNAAGNTITFAAPVQITEAPHTHIPVMHAANDASCSKEGNILYYECSICGKLFSDETMTHEVTAADVVVQKLPHTPVELPAVPASCKETGLTAGSKCSVCGEIITPQEVVQKLPHTHGQPVQENVVEATCLNEGSYDSVVYCTECGEEISREHKIVGKTAHTPVTDPYVAPTCETPGKTEGSHCSVCEQVFAAQVEIPALEHIWNAGEVTTPAKCEEDGVRTYTCLRDSSHTKTETIPAIGHEWGEWETVKEPECDVPGEEKRVCKHNEEHVETREIEAPGHDWGEWEVVEYSTCITHGLQRRVCKNNEEHVEELELALADHTWSEWKVIKPATETEDGIEQRQCTVKGCSAVETRSIPKLTHSHTLVKVNAKAATCENTGNVEYWVCNSCGKKYADSNGEREIVNVTLQALGHSWSEWRVTVPATVNYEGRRERICTRCGQTEYQVIPKLTNSGGGSGSSSGGGSGYSSGGNSGSNNTGNNNGSNTNSNTTTVTNQEYRLLEGNNEVWKTNSEEGIHIMTSSIAKKLTSVYVDGNLLPVKNYKTNGTAENMNKPSEITLLPEYLMTLDSGEHELEIRYSDGKATGKFTVEKVAATPTPKPSPTPTAQPSPSPEVSPSPSPDPDADKEVKTTKSGGKGIGRFVIPALLLLVAGGAGGGAVYMKRTGKDFEEIKEEIMAKFGRRDDEE